MVSEKEKKNDTPHSPAASTTDRTAVGIRQGILLLLIGIAIGTLYHFVVPPGFS
jgi:hypothetical protein